MSCALVVGCQWGDEGKGKVIDLLSAEADVVVRYAGGGNAGHTVEVGGRQYIFHLLPCGVLYEGTVNVVGNGVVVDPVSLVEEIEDCRKKGLKLEGRLFVSDLAHVTLAYHRRMDEAHEARRGAGKLGTTHRGIGPTYTDKMGRVGIKVGDLLDEDSFVAKVRRNLEEKNELFRTFYRVEAVKEEDIMRSYREYLPKLKPFIADTIAILRDELARGRRVLMEGAQGTLLDVDFGTYPYVTSSNPTAGGACTGAGIPPTAVTRIIGVAKAYTTRVGTGPLPTELSGEEEERLRIRGREYGATTGRPRRCGWFDSVAVRRAAVVNGLGELAVTKLDILDHLPRISVCVAYRYRGREVRDFPNRTEIVEKCEPVYEEVPGWEAPTTGIRKWDDLPAKAREYLGRIEELTGVRVSIVSIGPERGQAIFR